MFAMEKIWHSTGDSIYFNYIKKYVDQQVDNEVNVSTFMYEQTGEDKYKIAATKVREGCKQMEPW